MLCELIIENVAVIEKAVIDFRKGFTCLTGETGAVNPLSLIPSMQ